MKIIKKTIYTFSNYITVIRLLNYIKISFKICKLHSISTWFKIEGKLFNRFLITILLHIVNMIYK